MYCRTETRRQHPEASSILEAKAGRQQKIRIKEGV
jgi:hypothetical protein